VFTSSLLQKDCLLVLFLYVDNILMAINNKPKLEKFKAKLNEEPNIKDLECSGTPNKSHLT